MYFTKKEIESSFRSELRAKEYLKILEKYKKIEEGLLYWGDFYTKIFSGHEWLIEEEDLLLELKNIKKLIENVETFEEIELHEMNTEEKIKYLNFDENKLILLIKKILKSFDISMPKEHLKGLLGISVSKLADEIYHDVRSKIK